MSKSKEERKTVSEKTLQEYTKIVPSGYQHQSVDFKPDFSWPSLYRDDSPAYTRISSGV